MIIEVIFLKPFVYCTELTVGGGDYLVTINGSPNVHGWVHSDIRDALVAEGLAVNAA